MDLKHFGGGDWARPFPGDTGLHLLLGGEGRERLRHAPRGDILGGVSPAPRQ
jgi:hypothetical protein